MHIEQAKYFLALCDELNFTRAAVRCGITQPSLTNSIKRLEQEFGGKLFVRQPRTQLSNLGRAVRPHLEKVVKSAGLARRAATLHKNSSRNATAVTDRTVENGFAGR